jgi:glycosyltransferase involved in cell wall biosynthesis
MHILFLTDNFPPEGNAPATRTYEHAREWVQLGHRVTIITGAPNFPEGVVFPGYKNSWYHKEVLDGIEVRRVKTYIAANKGFSRRIVDFLSFMVSSFAGGLFVRQPDVIVGTSPQFFTALSAFALAACKRRPFILEIRDIWPASITAVGAMKRGRLIKGLEKLELFLYRRATRIISVTHSFKTDLVKRGVDAAKIDVVLNGVDTSTYQAAEQKAPGFAKPFGLSDKFVVGYIGTHGMAHALENVVSAAEKLKAHDKIRFVFAGGGATRAMVEALVAQKKLRNVALIPRQQKAQMPDVWSLCDVSLVHLKNTPLFSSVIPSKIFESMGMGIPIVIAGPEGESTEIIKRTGAGLVAEAENPDSLVEKVLTLYNDRHFYKTVRTNSQNAAAGFDRKHLAADMVTSFYTSLEAG